MSDRSFLASSTCLHIVCTPVPCFVLRFVAAMVDKSGLVCRFGPDMPASVQIEGTQGMTRVAASDATSCALDGAAALHMWGTDTSNRGVFTNEQPVQLPTAQTCGQDGVRSGGAWVFVWCRHYQAWSPGELGLVWQ